MMRRRSSRPVKRKGYIAAGAALVVIVTALLIFKGRQKGDPVTWRAGDRLVYAISSREVVRSFLPGSASMYKRITLKGRLNVRVFDVKEKSVRVGMQLAPLEMRVEGKRQKGAEKIFTSPFFVDFSKGGAILDFHFSNEIAARDEKSVKAMVRKFQFALGSSFSSSWTEEEFDQHGIFRARYRLTEKDLRKRKETYLTAEGEQETSIDIKKSDTTITLNKEKSWVQEVKARELLAFKDKDKVMMKTSSRMRLYYLGPGGKEDIALWKDSFDDRDRISSWQKLPKNKIPLADQVDRAKYKKLYGSLDAKAICRKMILKSKKFSGGTIQEIVRYLELYPEASLQLPDLLRDNVFNPNQRAMIVHALGRTGHEKAQEALSVIINDGGFKKENRVQAAVAFTAVPRPTDRALDSLWEAYNAGFSGTGTREVATTAILSLGNISSSLEKSRKDEQKAAAEEIRSKIVSEMSAARDLNTKVALMHAAGNTGMREMMRPVAEYASSESDHERAAAMAALSRFENKEADEILSTTLKNDKSPQVRNAAVLGMLKRESTDESLQTVMEKVEKEDNDIIRGGMYRYLVKNRDKPGVREKLRGALKTERSMEHRKLIYRALATRKKTP